MSMGGVMLGQDVAKILTIYCLQLDMTYVDAEDDDNRLLIETDRLGRHKLGQLCWGASPTGKYGTVQVRQVCMGGARAHAC